MWLLSIAVVLLVTSPTEQVGVGDIDEWYFNNESLKIL